MDTSLAELIKNKRSSARGGRRNGVRQCGSGGLGGCERGGATNFLSNGAVGGGGPMRRGRSMARRTNGLTPYSRGDVNASWTHDMYEGLISQQLRGGLSTTHFHKIVISNLDYGVTSADIQELFGEFGPLKSATVHYCRSGRSLGTAEVVFDNKNSVLKAIRQYNNVSLDGRFMKIELATDLSTVANLATSLSRPVPVAVQNLVKKVIYKGVKGDQGKRGNTRGISRGRRAGGRGGRKNKKKMPNKDILDEQLDSFIKSQKN